MKVPYCGGNSLSKASNGYFKGNMGIVQGKIHRNICNGMALRRKKYAGVNAGDLQ